MMKLCICFLVLAISTISRGQNATEETTPSDKPKSEAPLPVSPAPPAESNPLVNTTDLTSNKTLVTDESNNNVNATEEASTSTVTQVTTSTVPPVGVTSTSTEQKSTPAPDNKGSGSTSWGYVILVLIILVILILCVILYFLRRVSRTYSFDLQRPSPVSRLNEPTGTFEPVYLDDLDRPVPEDQVTTDDLSPPPVANGTSLPSEEKASSGESAPQEQPDANGLETSPVSNANPSSQDDSADKAPSSLNSASFLFDGIGEEQQNENNNNPSVCSSDPFVEINLDDPALCDQLLTCPEETSCVLPFSPFSFASSSS